MPRDTDAFCRLPKKDAYAFCRLAKRKIKESLDTHLSVPRGFLVIYACTLGRLQKLPPVPLGLPAASRDTDKYPWLFDQEPLGPNSLVVLRNCRFCRPIGFTIILAAIDFCMIQNFLLNVKLSI